MQLLMEIGARVFDDDRAAIGIGIRGVSKGRHSRRQCRRGQECRFFALIGNYGLGLSHRVLWLWGDAFVIFQGFVGQVDGFFELGVVAADDQVGALGDFVVGVDAVVFDDPFAAVVGGIEGEFGRSDAATITQRNAPGYTDEAAPSAGADDGADFFAAKEPRESVA